MIGALLNIKFLGDKAYLTDNHGLTLRQLGLPEVAKSFYSPAWWSVKVLQHRPEEHRLFLEIISYNIGECEFSPMQVKLSEALSGIETVTFRTINTKGLLTTLRGTRPITLLPPTSNIFSNEYGDLQDPDLLYAETPFPQSPVPKATFKVESMPKAPTRMIHQTFFVPIKNIRFKHGGVTFQKKFKGCHQTVEVEIVNYEIREEFDAVKNYFANVLKTKKIEVTASAEITAGEITKISAISPDIARITKELIDNVRFEFVKGTFRKRISVDIDKSLFTMDELFDTFTGNKFKSDTFYQNERELFEDLLQITDTKHYKHLRYLSSIHAHHIMKLRFVYKPFSFIFLVEGSRRYHIIWETLDTEEATYVWHVPKDMAVLKRTLLKIEDILNVIKVQGKTAYINTSEDPFKRIYHDYSDLVEGFVIWKGELESILI